MTSRSMFLALTLLTLLLAGTIVIELSSGSVEKGGMPPQSNHAASPPRAAAPAASPDRNQTLMQTIFARPLFSLDRRPPAIAPAGQAPATSMLPRVAGILIDGHTRSVIFAASGSEHPLVALEGAQIGRFEVQSIEAGQVTVVGPEGRRVLRPSFDPRPPAAASAPPGLPGLPGFPGLANLQLPPGTAAPASPRPLLAR